VAGVGGVVVVAVGVADSSPPQPTDARTITIINTGAMIAANLRISSPFNYMLASGL
jgi:hypothetical protein